MKKTYLLMLALIMGALIVSCTNQEEDKEITMTADAPEQVEIQHEPIPANEAQAMIQAYWPLHGKLLDCTDNAQSKVPQYIHVPYDDISDMVNTLDNNKLFVAMVEKEVLEGEEGLGEVGDKYTAIVFAGKTEAQKGKNEWTYFDFTRPCPPMCDTAGISGN